MATSLKSAGQGANIAGAGTNWTAFGNILASDNSRALCAAGAQSDYLAATLFGFDVGAPDTINGFTVEIEANTLDAAGTLDEVFLTKDGSTPVGNDLLAGTQVLTATDTYYTLGGATELGGTTWTVAEVEASTFGVLIKATGSTSDIRIDHVRVTLHYTAGVASGLPVKLAGYRQRRS